MTARARTKLRLGRALSLCYQCGLILFFAYTLVNKAIDMEAFILNLHKTGLYAIEHLSLVAWVVLGAEAVAITLLVLNSLWGYRFSLLMLSLFTGYISLLQYWGRYEVCGCCGILNGLPFYTHLSINAFIILSLSIALAYEKLYQDAEQRV